MCCVPECSSKCACTRGSLQVACMKPTARPWANRLKAEASGGQCMKHRHPFNLVRRRTHSLIPFPFFLFASRVPFCKELFYWFCSLRFYFTFFQVFLYKLYIIPFWSFADVSLVAFRNIVSTPDFEQKFSETKRNGV